MNPNGNSNQQQDMANLAGSQMQQQGASSVSNQAHSQMQNQTANPYQQELGIHPQAQPSTTDQRERFVAVQKNGDGDLTAFQTSNGRVMNYQEALQAVQAGQIAGVNSFKGRDGETYIRGDADGDPTNNLDQLPLF